MKDQTEMTRNYTEVVPFELAVKLKDAGFNEWTATLWESIAFDTYREVYFDYEKKAGMAYYPRPIYAHAFDWLMDRGIEVSVHRGRMGDYHYHVGIGHEPGRFKSWREAAYAAIEKALEIRKMMDDVRP